MKRRDFISKSAAIPLAGMSWGGFGMLTNQQQVSDPIYPRPILNLKERIAVPVIIESITIQAAVNHEFVVVRSSDGIQGITLVNFRMEHLRPLFHQLLVPFFIGKDARDLELILDQIAHDRGVYKYSGIPLFNPLGQLEIAVWDLLGKTASLPASSFFGTRIRSEIPMYISSLTRETSPEEEVEKLQVQLVETGAKAVKIKVGGRMSRNIDASEGRTENLLPLLRKKLGDELVIYADANSSYDANAGIEVASFLESYGVEIFEEPCYWEDYESNAKVRASLNRMKLAGGEQDTSYLRFRDLAKNHVYDILQPDLYYNGGLLRAFYVEKLAIQYGRTIAPHSPKDDPLAAPFFQFASVSPILEGFQEFPGGKKSYPNWYFPHFDIVSGKIQVPTGPGLGLEYDLTFD
jgi:L-alanine-DL-glutamate epimerase-like enolase superfamily enzyme